MGSLLTNLVFWLHSAALLLQLFGALLVVLEIRSTLSNFGDFRDALSKAEEKKDEHREALNKESGGYVPGFGGGYIRKPVFSPEVIEGAVQQAGPGAAMERQALRDFVARQFTESPLRRWLGVGLVVIGSLVGYAANIVGL